MSPRQDLDLSLYLVTSSAITGRDGLVQTVVEAVRGGVTIVQLREPDAPDAEVLAMAKDLVQALAPTGVPVVIDDRVHLVQAAGAAGVHIGQTDMPAAQARGILGDEALIGLSAHTSEQAEVATTDGYVDYLGIGPAWPTPTKDTGREALGPEGIRSVAAATPLPSVAIGGIDASRVERLHGAGVDGVAVVRAICGASDPARAAAQLRALWEQVRRHEA